MSFHTPESLHEAARAEWARLQALPQPLKPRDRLAIPMQEMPTQEPLARARNMQEVAIGYFEEQARVEAARCLQCKNAPCVQGCPVRIRIPQFIAAIAEGDMAKAIAIIKETSLLPAVCGRVCPQETQCQEPCTVGKSLKSVEKAVSIGRLERYVADWERAKGAAAAPVVAPPTGKKVAVVGAGPAGMAAAQQLARAGHDVTVFEKNDRVGGLLRYGIPDFKMEKSHIDRRVEQMKAEGVVFRTGVVVGAAKDPLGKGSKVTNLAKETVTPEELQKEFDAVLLTGGAEQSRDLPVPGRDLDGIHFAMEFLPQQNRVNAGDKVKGQLRADGKHVIVIGGGDTGSDCVGTSNRHGAASVTQFELMPMPPEQENKPLVWPYWPYKLRTSSSHEEGCEREFAISTKEFMGEKGKVTGLKTVQVEFKDGKFVEVPGTEKVFKADLVLLAMGFVSPVATVLDAFGVEKDARGNARATTDFDGGYATNVPKVFAAGDIRRGQSLVVWAIREGRQAARSVDEFLMGYSDLPR